MTKEDFKTTNNSDEENKIAELYKNLSNPDLSDSVKDIIRKEIDSLENSASITPEIDEKVAKKKSILQNPAILGLIGVSSALILALLTHFFLLPILQVEKAREELNGISRSYGVIRPFNTDLMLFEGKKMENVNFEQKGLSKNGIMTTPPAFIFTNGKDYAKKKFEVYIDFSEQRSRDFILLNQNVIKKLVESGTMDLHIHAVPTGKPYSMYAAETLAETFYTSPDKAWEALIELLKLSAVIETENIADPVESILEKIERIGVTGVDEESIRNGTFASWIVSISDDERLVRGVSFPLIYLNNNVVDHSLVDINNPDAIQKFILNSYNSE